MANRLIEILIEIKGGAESVLDGIKKGASATFDKIFSLKSLLMGLASGAVVRGIERLVNVFAEQETAVTKLNAALRVSGRFTQEASDAIQKMADRMRETTVHTDEEALAVSATFASMAKELTATQLAEAQKLAIGFADATGRSVEGAAMLIVRSLTGQGNALKRYGIDLDNAGSQQEKFMEVQRKLGPMFAISEAQAKTLAGAIRQAQNEFNEVREAIGELIARFLGVDEKANTLRDTFKKWREEIMEHGHEWIKYGRDVVAVFKFIFAVVDSFVQYLVSNMIVIASILVNGFKAIDQSIRTVVMGLWESIKFLFKEGVNAAIIRPLNNLLDAMPELVKQAVGITIGTIKELDNTDPFTNTKDAAANVAAAIRQIGETAREQEAITNESFAQVGDAWKRMIATFETLPPPKLTGASKAGAGENIGVAVDESLEEKLRRIKEEQKLLTAEYQAGQIPLSEFRSKMAALEPALRDLQLQFQKNRGALVEMHNKLKETPSTDIFKTLTDRSIELRRQLDAGDISAGDYKTQLAALKAETAAFLVSMGAAPSVIQAVGRAMSEGRAEAFEFLNADKALRAELDKFRTSLANTSAQAPFENILDRAAALRKQLKDNDISTQDYDRSLAGLKVELRDVMTAAGASADMIDKVTRAMDQGQTSMFRFENLDKILQGNREQLIEVFQALSKIQDFRVDELLQKAARLKAQWDAGAIGVKEYNDQNGALVKEMEVLLRTLGMTEEQIKKITDAMREGKSQHVGFGKSLEKAFGLAEGAGGAAIVAANEELAKMSHTLATGFTDAIGAAVFAGANFGKAVQKAVGDAAKSFARLSAGRALMELAEGLAALAMGQGTVAAQHFTAAKIFGASAVAMGAIGAAVGGSGGGAGGAGGPGALGADKAAGTAQTKGSATIIIEGGILDMSNPNQAEAMRKALAELSDREVILRGVNAGAA